MNIVPQIPNDETLSAMDEIDSGDAPRFASADDLFEDLGI